MKKGDWDEDKLLRCIDSAPAGFYYNPFSWSSDKLHKCVKKAVKAGVVEIIPYRVDSKEVRRV